MGNIEYCCPEARKARGTHDDFCVLHPAKLAREYVRLALELPGGTDIVREELAKLGYETGHTLSAPEAA